MTENRLMKGLDAKEWTVSFLLTMLGVLTIWLGLDALGVLEATGRSFAGVFLVVTGWRVLK